MNDNEQYSDIFDRLADRRFADQAGLDDDDYVFKPKKNTKVETQEDTAINDELKSRTEKLSALRDENERWEKVRREAQRNKLDPKRIAKVSQRISEIFFEIQEHERFIEKNGKAWKQKREIESIEQQIDQLESERAGLDSKLALLNERLRTLRPYKASDDYQNDPQTLNTNDEDEFESLANMIAERRKACQEAGEYNSTHGVVIKNPQPTRDDTFF